MKIDINELLNELNPRERTIVKLRFGLEDGKARTLQEMGKLFSVCKERVRQIESTALYMLRHSIRSRKLQRCLEDLEVLPDRSPQSRLLAVIFGIPLPESSKYLCAKCGTALTCRRRTGLCIRCWHLEQRGKPLGKREATTTGFIVNRVREYRHKLGITENELAKRVGIASPNISNIELGKMMAWPKLKHALSQVLKVNEETLFPDKR